MQHFVQHAVDAIRDAVGLSVFARADTSAARTLKLKTTKTTKTAV